MGFNNIDRLIKLKNRQLNIETILKTPKLSEKNVSASFSSSYFDWSIKMNE